MKHPHLEAPLKSLVLKYREISFAEWERLYSARDQYHDYSSENEKFWQAHTDVLEVDTHADGRRYANVSISIYPEGVYSVPPAPHAGFLCFDDGTCDIGTPWGEDYIYKQRNDES
jgi:hypothetical protein